MGAYASNTPVSKPALLPVTEHKSLGGMSWNNKIGLFFPVEDEMPPFRLPTDHSALRAGLTR